MGGERGDGLMEGGLLFLGGVVIGIILHIVYLYAYAGD